jgi:drug/metabolite transporter (DMT)-like permease
VAWLTWASALAGLPAVTVAMYLFLASVLAALWGWLFDGSAPGWPFVPGALLVLAGLLIMARTGGGRRAAEPGAPPPSEPAAEVPRADGLDPTR